MRLSKKKKKILIMKNIKLFTEKKMKKFYFLG